MAKGDIIIQKKNGIRLDHVKGQKTVVQAVVLRANHLKQREDAPVDLNIRVCCCLAATLTNAKSPPWAGA